MNAVARTGGCASPARRTGDAQSGLSLVELMISMAISLVILAALVLLFTNTSRSNREFARANGMIESGRLALQVLEADVLHGAYWGTHVAAFDDQTLGTVPDDAPTSVPDPCLAYAAWTEDHLDSLIGIPLQAYDDAVICPGILLDRLPGTDVLVVRHAENCVPGGPSPNCEGLVAGRLYFQSSLCATDVEAYLFGTAGFDLRRRDCATLAEIRRFMSTIYYVRDYAVTPGDGIPTLMRSQFDVSPGGELEQQAAMPLIEGIAAFRVELGVDDLSETATPVDYTTAVSWVDPETRTSASNRGDGVPDDAFVHCTTAAPCTVAELANVTAARLYVLAQSREVSRGYTDSKTYTLGDTVLGPFDDAFQRHLFVTTVRLPNVAGRRITP
jgi:type IV pilus assembly protein PilW